MPSTPLAVMSRALCSSSDATSRLSRHAAKGNVRKAEPRAAHERATNDVRWPVHAEVHAGEEAHQQHWTNDVGGPPPVLYAVHHDREGYEHRRPGNRMPARIRRPVVPAAPRYDAGA